MNKCINCQKEFETTSNNAGQKFCNRECYRENFQRLRNSKYFYVDSNKACRKQTKNLSGEFYAHNEKIPCKKCKECKHVFNDYADVVVNGVITQVQNTDICHICMSQGWVDVQTNEGQETIDLDTELKGVLNVESYIKITN